MCYIIFGTKNIQKTHNNNLDMSQHNNQLKYLNIPVLLTHSECAYLKVFMTHKIKYQSDFLLFTAKRSNKTAVCFLPASQCPTKLVTRSLA